MFCSVWKAARAPTKGRHFFPCHPVCIAHWTQSIRLFIGPRKRASGTDYREIKSVWIASRMLQNKSHLYENILFATYSFTTIFNFRIIAVFESVMRAMQSGWIRVSKMDVLRVSCWRDYSGVCFFSPPRKKEKKIVPKISKKYPSVNIFYFPLVTWHCL